ncbi:hypothetical protein [Paenibacillus campinasensis]|uniref:Uncharacterized protein n=1 Tax=Paenibacillus campinasensis TaxID=66347 RepID=A0A268F2U6_9BACL|nr:hypothetical protein [Paenibacillus campinasensis]PAD79705.1 hypothetical protein CHH67_03015 [Paenibacillus campinasensis]
MTINDIQPELSEALSIVARQLNQAGPNWLLGGSCGLLLQGVTLDRPPRDMDVYADAEGIGKLHDVLSDHTLDKPAVDEEEMYLSIRGHYEVNEILLELIGGFKIRVGGSVYTTEIDNLLYPAAPATVINGHSVHLMPLAHELVFNVLRDRPDRYLAISESIRLQPEAHRGILERMMGSYTFHAGHVALIRELTS